MKLIIIILLDFIIVESMVRKTINNHVKFRWAQQFQVHQETYVRKCSTTILINF